MKKGAILKVLIVIAALAALGGILKMFDKNEPAPAPAKTETKEITVQERIAAAAKKTFKDLTEVQVNLAADQVGRINITTKIKDGLSGKTIKNNALKSATEFLKEIQDEQYESVFIINTADFTDKYGNKEERPILKMEILKEEADKINFDNFDHKKLESSAKTFEVHESIKE